MGREVQQLGYPYRGHLHRNICQDPSCPCSESRILFQRKHAIFTTRIYKTGVSRAIYSAIAFGLGDVISYFIPATIFYYGTVIIISGSLPVSAVEVVNLLLFGICNSIMMLSFVP